MARCNRCRTNRHEFLYSFGGVAVCESCYDDVNPQLITYKLMHPSSVSNVENKLMELRKQVRVYEQMLKINNELIEQGVTTLTKKIPRTK
jgi:hypothetical protein